MDMDLIVIFTFILLAASLVFSMAHKFHRRAVEHEERKLELKARIAEARANENRMSGESIAHLEDRMRVLERIVTDPQADLARKIEDLRGPQVSEDNEVLQ